MRKNIKITMQYDGTRYDGWQKQGNTEHTIQGKLEAILLKLTGEAVEVHGAGRTDAGVHALEQTANFFLSQPVLLKLSEEGKGRLTSLQYLKKYLNKYLPEDIAVLELCEVPPRFHSRLNAVSKTYRYQIETGDKKSVFERKYMYGLSQSLDIRQMKKAAECLTGTHDFKAFSSLKKTKKSTVRTIREIKIEKEGTKVFLTFEGDGFLYNMVRIIAGTLIEAGLGKRTPEEVSAALKHKDRAEAGKTAPPEGLFLVKVTY